MTDIDDSDYKFRKEEAVRLDREAAERRDALSDDVKALLTQARLQVGKTPRSQMSRNEKLIVDLATALEDYAHAARVVSRRAERIERELQRVTSADT